MVNQIEPVRLLAGSGRSGTTWILDVLAETNKVRPVFEPLNPYMVADARPYANHYLPAESNAPGLEKLVRDIVSGGFESHWTDYRIHAGTLMPGLASFRTLGGIASLGVQWKNAWQRYRRFKPMKAYSPPLLKIIRGNFLLEWFAGHFNARIVFVVRHPGAVVESRLRSPWDPYVTLARYEETGVIDAIGARYRHLLAEKLDVTEAHALVWCIGNQWPLEWAAATGHTVVAYENLIADGETEWQRIIDTYGFKFNPCNAEILDRPSQQAGFGWDKRKGGVLDSWVDRLGQRNLAAVERVLTEVGFTDYHADQVMPAHDFSVAAGEAGDRVLSGQPEL